MEHFLFIQEQNSKMEKKGEELPSVQQTCACTQEVLKKDYPELKLADDCPVCKLYSRRCAIGMHHRSEASTTQQGK
jgi:hypothetical protein